MTVMIQSAWKTQLAGGRSVSHLHSAPEEFNSERPKRVEDLKQDHQITSPAPKPLGHAACRDIIGCMTQAE